MTVLYFLNDVEEGGETAFPLADNVTLDQKVRLYLRKCFVLYLSVTWKCRLFLRGAGL